MRGGGLYAGGDVGFAITFDHPVGGGDCVCLVKGSWLGGDLGGDLECDT